METNNTELMRLLASLSARVGKLEALLHLVVTLGPFEYVPKTLRATIVDALIEGNDTRSDTDKDHGRAYRIGG